MKLASTDPRRAAAVERLLEVSDEARREFWDVTLPVSPCAVGHVGGPGMRQRAVRAAAEAMRLVVELCDPSRWTGCAHDWRPTWPHLRPLERCGDCGAFRSPDLPGEIF